MQDEQQIKTGNRAFPFLLMLLAITVITILLVSFLGTGINLDQLEGLP